MNSEFYQNPILCADYSDPDIVRVGNDFFMVSSSFNHMPGLPVLHSTDLVHWQIINHAIPALNLPGYEYVQPGKGVWAPSLRVHDDRFWIFFSTPDEGIFMCHTADPWGEWSEPHCVVEAKGWIDPCPLWDDDGRAWLVHAFAQSRSGIKHQLQLFEMTPDGRSLLGEGKIIYDGTCDLPTLEGPKLYKRQGYYYIFAPAGGVESGWQSVLRARTMAGPWEVKNVLFQGQTAINGPHQGGWVELDNGECWFVHFQDAHLYGRVVHLQPMWWGDDGWPRIGEQRDDSGTGQPVLRWRRPAVGAEHYATCQPQTSDEFASGKYGLQWQWQARPRADWLVESASGLSLRCTPLPVRYGDGVLYGAAHLLLQKFPALRFSAMTRLSLQAEQDGDAGGLIIYGERYAALTLEKREDACWLVYLYGWMTDAGHVLQTRQPLEPLRASTCALRVEVKEGGICHFAWREDDEGEWRTVNRPFAAGKGKWVGAKVGLFAAAPGVNAGGVCHFSHFSVAD